MELAVGLSNVKYFYKIVMLFRRLRHFSVKSVARCEYGETYYTPRNQNDTPPISAVPKIPISYES